MCIHCTVRTGVKTVKISKTWFLVQFVKVCTWGKPLTNGLENISRVSYRIFSGELPMWPLTCRSYINPQYFIPNFKGESPGCLPLYETIIKCVFESTHFRKSTGHLIDTCIPRFVLWLSFSIFCYLLVEILDFFIQVTLRSSTWTILVLLASGPCQAIVQVELQ